MIEAELPDGTVLEFPAGTSPSVVQAAVKRRLGAAPAKQESLGDQVLQTAKNIGGGLVRGAGSIGATILTPVDAAARALGVENSFIGRTDRRAAMDEGLRELGADPESLAYKGGKIGAEIAGTAGAGGMLARGAQAARAPQMLVEALRTAGMSSGGATGAAGLGAQVAGGAATGAAAAGIVNPEDAATGAVIGGALPLATQAIRSGVSGARRAIGATTGAGDEALRVAYESGKAGGSQAQAFRDNMRGKTDMTQVLDDARANLDAMRQSRSAAYRQNMASVQADNTVLDMAPIDQAVQGAINKFTFKGQARNPQVLNALQDVSDEVNAWRQLDPAQFHTPEGLDALKQRVGAVLEKLPFEAKAARSAVSDVYNGIKRQIETQAPEYSKAMKDYNEASQLLSEIERSLSLGQRASADTAMRKLQSVMRNNVNTNYGVRQSAVEALEQQGGRELMPALAGQALNDWMPRGIQRATSPLGVGAAGFTAGLPAAAVAAAVSSPRLMGEAAYLAGSAAADPRVQALRRQLYRAAPVMGAQD